MLARLRPKIGQPGVVLVALIAISVLGALAAATIGAALAVIPIIGLVALALLPFPTLLPYLLAILVVFLLLLKANRRWAEAPSTGKLWALAGLAAVIVVGSSTAMAQWWNSAAGVADLAPEPSLAPLSVEPGSTLALIGEGPIFPDQPCNPVCMTMLLGGQVDTLLIAEAKKRPDLKQPVQGYALRWNAQGRECLRGKSYYTMMVGGSAAERRRDFRSGFGGNLGYEMIECLEIKQVVIDPLAQPTIVNWEHPDYMPSGPNVAGLIDTALVQAVVAVGTDGTPQVAKRTGKEGFRYLAPLAIWPYGGNAGMGGRFEPGLWLQHFRTIPYGESRETGWWPLIADSEAMIDRTVAYLEEVTIRENYVEWRKRTGRDVAEAPASRE